MKLSRKGRLLPLNIYYPVGTRRAVGTNEISNTKKGHNNAKIRQKQGFLTDFFGAFMRGNKPLVLPGVKEGFSKAKTGELDASPTHLKRNKTSKYNSKGLATALLKYEEELNNEI